MDPGLSGASDRPVAGIDNGFVAGYRVRFDEAGPDGRIRTSALLRYAQDVAWRHSEALGFDRQWYVDRGLWWVVRAVDLEVLRPVGMGQTIRVSTAVTGHRRIWARPGGPAARGEGPAHPGPHGVPGPPPHLGAPRGRCPRCGRHARGANRDGLGHRRRARPPGPDSRGLRAELHEPPAIRRDHSRR